MLVRERALFGTGFLPDTEQQIYRLPEDELYLVGTSEVPLASLHDAEILAGADLPLRYAGYSPCFRREAGAAGKDTRGIFRVHQFDKVEMFSFVEPSSAAEEHERLLAIEESILADLGIPYRVVAIAVNDLGASAAKKYDCEAWLPGQGRYRELTSTSNTTDFQARRLDIRYRPGRGAAGLRPHLERDRGGGGADDHRAARERPAGRRIGGLPRRAGRAGRAGGAAGCGLVDRAQAPVARALQHDQGGPGRPAGSDPGPHPHAEGVPRPDDRAHGLLGPAGGIGDGGGKPGRGLGLGVGGHEQLGHRPVDRLLLAERQQGLGAAGHGLDQQRAVDDQEGVTVAGDDLTPGLEQQAETARAAHAGGGRGGLVLGRGRGAMAAEPGPLSGLGASPFYQPQCRPGSSERVHGP